MQAASTTESDLLNTLTKRTNNGVSNMTVRLDDSHVVIGGNASSYYVKQVITQTALKAVGQGRVRNEIDVCPPQRSGSPVA